MHPFARMLDEVLHEHERGGALGHGCLGLPASTKREIDVPESLSVTEGSLDDLEDILGPRG